MPSDAKSSQKPRARLHGRSTRSSAGGGLDGSPCGGNTRSWPGILDHECLLPMRDVLIGTGAPQNNSWLSQRCGKVVQTSPAAAPQAAAQPLGHGHSMSCHTRRLDGCGASSDCLMPLYNPSTRTTFRCSCDFQSGRRCRRFKCCCRWLRFHVMSALPAGRLQTATPAGHQPPAASRHPASGRGPHPAATSLVGRRRTQRPAWKRGGMGRKSIWQ